jgi:membrane associated rhomboid family serine protease
MIPIGDEQRIERVPAITATLLVVITVIFVWQQQLNEFSADQLVLAFGLNPAHLFGFRDPSPHMSFVPVGATLITYVFLHGGWGHLLGNGLFLWVFGPAVENALGSLRFSGLFLFTVAISAVTQALPLMEQQVQLIGASGAISGLIGAYIMLFPKGRLIVLGPGFGLWFNRVPVLTLTRYRCPSVILIGIWFTLQLVVAILFSSSAGGVAFLAHIGGFLCGGMLTPILRRAEFPLFGGG